MLAFPTLENLNELELQECQVFGKSHIHESLVNYLIKEKKKKGSSFSQWVNPSSNRNRGSILGD